MLEISRKKITKRKKANLSLKIIMKIPSFLQPIRSYKVIGDFVINDSIFLEQTTTKSNCLLFNLNSYKKITQIFFDEELSLKTIRISSYNNAFSPNIGLLIERLRSLSNSQAKTFSSVLINISNMFTSFKQTLDLSNSMKSPEEIKKNREKFDEAKILTEKQFLSSLDHQKPLIIVNTIYNHENNNFEINEIKINSVLIQILGYKPYELVEHFFNLGFPGLFLFDDYFQGLTNIIISRLSGQGSFFKIKLITSDEEHLYGETKTHNCKVLFENCFWSSFAFEIKIFEWSLKKYKENKMKISKKLEDLNEYRQDSLLNKNLETGKFMKRFYPKILKEKFQGKFALDELGIKELTKKNNTFY